MAQFIVRISKTIDIGVVVEAETIEGAYDAPLDLTKIVDVQDAGWDVIWDAQELTDPAVKYLGKSELENMQFLPLYII